MVDIQHIDPPTITGPAIASISASTQRMKPSACVTPGRSVLHRKDNLAHILSLVQKILGSFGFLNG